MHQIRRGDRDLGATARGGNAGSFASHERGPSTAPSDFGLALRRAALSGDHPAIAAAARRLMGSWGSREHGQDVLNEALHKARTIDAAVQSYDPRSG